MQIVQAYTNGVYPNRIQLVITSPFFGPFSQAGPLGAFNPARDLNIYVDGSLQTVQSWAFDTTNNRYLIYFVQVINPQGFVQIVHHVPNPPFQAIVQGSPTSAISVPGFALVGIYIPSGDIAIPEMTLTASPAVVPLGTASTLLLWLTAGVAKVDIVGLFGSPPFATGFLGANGVYVLPLPDISSILTLIMTGYDSSGNPIYVGSPPEILMVTATVTITSISGYLVQDDGSRFLLDDGSGFFLLDA